MTADIKPVAQMLRDRAEEHGGDALLTGAADAIDSLRAEVAAVWNAMPSGTRYLDPPDGGCVPLHEQVRRMAADATRAERLQAELDNRWAQGVHSCHDKCQRIACVLRRDNKRLAEALRAALEATRGALQDAYQSAGQECCGRSGTQECCGVPETVWTPEDQAVMDKLGPIERLLSSALRDHDQEVGNG